MTRTGVVFLAALSVSLTACGGSTEPERISPPADASADAISYAGCEDAAQFCWATGGVCGCGGLAFQLPDGGVTVVPFMCRCP
jgi:hypothetical protein